MAFDHACGVVRILATDVATTTFEVTTGFQPKALRFHWNGRGENATDALARATTDHGHGFATSTSNRMCVGARGVDGSANSDNGVIKRIDAVVATMELTTPGPNGLIDISAIGSTSFTLVVDDQLPIDLDIQWEAWGGSDITNAIVIEEVVNTITAGADIAITGAGFTGTIAFLAGVDVVTVGNTADNARCGISFGAFTGASDEHVICDEMVDDGSAAGDCWSYCRAGECLGYFPAAMAAGLDGRLQFVSWDADGYTLDVIENARNNRRFITLIIQGGSWKIGDITTLTSVTTQSSGSIGFAPTGVSVHSSWMAQHAADTATNHAQSSHGVASRVGANQSVLALLDENAVLAMEITTAIDFDKVYKAISTASALEGEAAVSAWGSDDFTWSQTDADPSGRFAWYIACGPFAAAGVAFPFPRRDMRIVPLI